MKAIDKTNENATAANEALDIIERYIESLDRNIKAYRKASPGMILCHSP